VNPILMGILLVWSMALAGAGITLMFIACPIYISAPIFLTMCGAVVGVCLVE